MVLGALVMEIKNGDQDELLKLIAQLDADRIWLLEQIDRGRWPELRFDLAALERELGQLLAKLSKDLDEGL